MKAKKPEIGETIRVPEFEYKGKLHASYSSRNAVVLDVIGTASELNYVSIRFVGSPVPPGKRYTLLWKEGFIYWQDHKI